MKNYYYFLGVNTNASEEDIRRAYRKLSLKYHPDKNDSDIFFAERFRQLQEAYEILIDAEKREAYNQSLKVKSENIRSQNPPCIINFSANKIRVKKDDEIRLYWETNSADMVKILPFGLEKTSGERVFKIKEFKNGKFQVILQATNTLLNKSEVKGITFVEVSEHRPDDLLSLPQIDDKPTSGSHKILYMILGFVLLFYFLLKIILGF